MIIDKEIEVLKSLNDKIITIKHCLWRRSFTKRFRSFKTKAIKWRFLEGFKASWSC